MDCRTTESGNFKRKLGFTLHDAINTKEQAVLKSIKDVFKGENMKTQYNFLRYRIYLYFHDYKLAIEVGDINHKIGCKFMRIDFDQNDYDIF